MQLGNHLGNVLVTISDKKKGIADPLNAALIKYFEPIMLSGTDYYPFGMAMRVGGDSSYRYGFNGKENDNEVKGGEGLQQDYGMRVYDNRLGRFLSVDPLTKIYPMLTPYQFASNMPISAIDIDGLEKYYFNLALDEKTKKPVLTLTNKVYSYKDVDGKTVNFNDINYIVAYENETYTFSTNPIIAGDFGVAPVNTIENLEQWYSQSNTGGQDVGPFDDIFFSRREAMGIVFDMILNEWAVGLAGLNATKPQGTIYEVPGSATSSGKPYIGRHNQANPAKTRKSNDGRDRTKARVIDTYDEANEEVGALREQRAIDASGGKSKLDNKRNETNPQRKQLLEKKYNGYGGKTRPVMQIQLPRKSKQKEEKNKQREELMEKINHG